MLVANAGEIAPKVPGIDGATVRKRLEESYRELPQCARCLSKIDPLGFALENYNAAGDMARPGRVRLAEAAKRRRPEDRRTSIRAGAMDEDEDRRSRGAANGDAGERGTCSSGARAPRPN